MRALTLHQPWASLVATGDHEQGWDPLAEAYIDVDLRLPCTKCDGIGRCDPIPARGRQGLWNWTPEGIAA